MKSYPQGLEIIVLGIKVNGSHVVFQGKMLCRFLFILFFVFMDLNINQGWTIVIINSHKESLYQIKVQSGFIDRPPVNILR